MSFNLTKDSKKIIIIAVIVFIISAIALALLVGKNQGQTPEEVVIVEQDASETIVVTTRNIFNNTNVFEVNVKMPYFDKLPYQYNTFLNDKIRSELDYTNVYNSLTSGLRDKSNVGLFKYDADYVRYNFKDFVSVVVKQNITLGDNRPTELLKTYIVNAKKGNTALLQDVMENKVDYKRKIVDYINTEAFKQKIELVGGRGLSTLQDTQKFYITNDGKLHVCFEAGDVSPVADGMLDFEMPFTWGEEGFVY